MFGRKKPSFQQQNRLRNSRKKELGRVLRLESLSKRELLAADLSLVDPGLAAVDFGQIQESINTRIQQAPAPFIGDAIATELGNGANNSSQFVSRIDERAEAFALNDVSEVNISSVTAAIHAAFDGFAEVDIEVSGQDGDSDIRFDVTLSGSRSYLEGVTLDLVGADPEIDLRAGGEDQVELDMDWSYKLSFGVRESGDGSSVFYHDTSSSNEVVIEFTATIKNDFDSGRGKVGVFFGEIQADQDNPSQVSRFRGRYTLDISQNDSGTTTIAGTLTGAGEANLDVRGSFLPKFDADAESGRLIDLAVTADGKVTYRTDITFEADGQVDWTHNNVEVALEDVTVDLGKIYTEFVDPLVSDLQESLKPLKPMVEFLNKPLPVISDVYELAGKGSVTALKLAGYGADHPLVRTLNTIDAILNYRGLEGAASDSSENLLSFSLSKSGVDSKTAAREQADRESRLEHFRNNGLQIQVAEKHRDPEKHAEWEKSLAWSSKFDGAIDLPFLTDSDTLVGFLLGDTHSEFFTFELAGNFNMELSVDVPIVPLANMVSLVGGLGVEFKVDLDGGYDATGIDQLSDAADYSSRSAFDASVATSRDMLWNGFYLDDHNTGSVDNGSTDAPEATLQVSVGAGLQAGLDIIVASLTIEGRAILETDLEFDLNDLPEPAAVDSRGAPIWSNITPTNASEWEYDGRVRFQELKHIVDANPGALFNVNGVLQAGMDAGVEAKVLGFTVYSNTWELFRVTLIDEKLSEPDDAKMILGEDPPQLASLSSEGELTLFVGDQAFKRNRDAHVRDEVYSVQSLGESRNGGETMMVTFESDGETHSQYFHGVNRISADAGSGNDEIRVLPGTNIQVNLSGGSGNDTLVAMGSGIATLRGDEGHDKLVGGSANDILIGGIGDDEIRGGAGDDEIHGNQGDDRLFGDGGDDTLDGGDGRDELDGGVGNDVLYGRTGNDRLFGSAGDDTLWGGTDNDQLRGGLGSDIVYGEGGRDRIQFSFLLNENAQSEENSEPRIVEDQIFGGADIDTIEILGSEAADRIHLEQSGSTIHVTGSTYSEDLQAFEQVSDFSLTLPEAIEDRDIEQLQISGGNGDDHISAHGWFNVNDLILLGEDGDDTIQGGNSRNFIDGGLGDDNLSGGLDRDVIYGGSGDDIIAAGDGDDAVYGEAGDDTIAGEGGSDNLSGGLGDDVIYANDAESIELGVVAGDALMGDEGNDKLFGSLGNDELFGGEGDDHLYGLDGDDVLFGDNGSDQLIGGLGHDRLFGGEGNDFLYAQFDTPIEDMLTESGESFEPVNRLYGGGGNDLLRGSQHFDRLSGDAGNDTFEHTSGGDIVFGGAGDDDRYIVFGTQGSDAIELGFSEDAMGGTPLVSVKVNDSEPIVASHLEIERVGADGLGGSDTFVMSFGENAALPVVLRGGEGDDRFVVEHFQGDLEVDGGQGNDEITARLTSAQLADGTFADRHMTISDNELKTDHLTYQLSSIEIAELTGNAADNTLDAGSFSGSVVLVGLAGDDRLVSAGGDDLIDGGTGIDTIVAQADADFILNDTSLKGKGLDTLRSMERAELIGGDGDNRMDASASRFGTVTLRGGAGNDTLIGGLGADHLYGDSGEDTLDGTIGGVDYLYGGDGNDSIVGANDYAYGEGGDDTLRTAGSQVSNRLANGGAGNDRLYGSNLYDKLEGGDGNDILYGYAGNDRLYGENGNDVLYGHAGDDLLVGGWGNDIIYGHDGTDHMHGNQGNDTLYGGSGNDYLYGHEGHDRLYGGSGSDLLMGADGNDYLDGGRDGREDRLYGGSGHDTAVQYRYWKTTFAWFGYWVNQEKIYSTESYVYRAW